MLRALRYRCLRTHPSHRAERESRHVISIHERWGRNLCDAGDLPKPNKCITFALYEVGDKPGTTLLGAGTGSLWRSTQSNFVIFHYTYDCLHAFGQQQLLRVGDLPASAKPRSRSSHGVQPLPGNDHKRQAR